MANGSYLGGSTKVSIGEKGTQWEIKWDESAAVEEYFDRWDKRGDVKFDSDIARYKRQRKEFTYFIRACAAALSEETLSQNFPPPPRFLRNSISKAGGNVKWLYSDSELVKLLTRFVNLHLVIRNRLSMRPTLDIENIDAALHRRRTSRPTRASRVISSPPSPPSPAGWCAGSIGTGSAPVAAR